VTERYEEKAVKNLIKAVNVMTAIFPQLSPSVFLDKVVIKKSLTELL